MPILFQVFFKSQRVRQIFYCIGIAFCFLGAAFLSCDFGGGPAFIDDQKQLQLPPILTVEDVQTLITQAVEVAESLNESISVGILDREGNILGSFVMTGSTPGPLGDVPEFLLEFAGVFEKARTVCYLSSNQFALTTVTACYVTRKHFPPGINNVPGGPLFGVTYSSQNGSDVYQTLFNEKGFPQNTARGRVGSPGLSGVPGGVPIYKNGLLAGGIGINGGSDTLPTLLEYLDKCTSDEVPATKDELIALGAVKGFEAPDLIRADQIFIEGIRFRFKNAPPPDINFTLTFADLAGRGAVGEPIRATVGPNYPVEGYFIGPKAGSLLTLDDVMTIVEQCRAETRATRSAVRRPLGVEAQEFISVVDVAQGEVLALFRTADALLDAIDAVPQKARTALAYSDPNQPLGQNIRSILGLAANAPLAVSTRAVGFLAQDFFPAGIDEETLGRDVEEGPLFEGTEFGLQRRLSFDPTLPPYGNGIAIFGGGFPVYKNGQLAGGVGVSGDGTEQSDLIGLAGTAGFEPPPEIRIDQFKFRDVRIPYATFPRSPGIGGGN